MNEQVCAADGSRDFAVLGELFDRRTGSRRIARPFRTSNRSMTLRVCDSSLSGTVVGTAPNFFLESTSHRFLFDCCLLLGSCNRSALTFSATSTFPPKLFAAAGNPELPGDA